MTTRVSPDLATVRAAVEDVPDPELPPVTLGMLGMVHDVTVDGHTVTVELLPTFAGCPATDVMAEDVAEAVQRVEGVEEVAVRFRFSPAWTPAQITDEGHERLREFGIAPPTGKQPAPLDRPDRPTLPVLGSAADPRPCPYCGSGDTSRETTFGPTPCRDIRFCNACRQPFEAFKDL